MEIQRHKDINRQTRPKIDEHIDGDRKTEKHTGRKMHSYIDRHKEREKKHGKIKRLLAD
jgi:hypothetical protein